MKTIVVNATALDRSGALTILKQFIESIPSDEFSYLIFVSNIVDLSYKQSNIRIESIANVKLFFKRFVWDAFGVKKWLKENGINPVAAISLQNTNFRVGNDIPNYIYYHQPIPFVKRSWSLFKTEQRPLWFYKNIYPFFISLFINKRTEIFVQLEFVKKKFAKKFNISKSRIHVITPKTKLPAKNNIIDVELEADKINLFYPATPFFYKNHRIIIEALSKQSNNTVLYLTCRKEDLNIESNTIDIRFMGVVSFETVLGMYAKADALVFPSYIETYGLPLIEAATFGIPVLAADLPYSREVLKGYEGVEYIDYRDSQEWADAIEKLRKGKKYKPFTLPETKSWRELFEIIKQNL